MTLALALLACVDDPTGWDSADSGTPGETGDSGDSGSSCRSTVTWSAAGLSLLICGEGGPYFLGMAETGSGSMGWYGESCIDGPEPSGMDDYGYDYCHDELWLGVLFELRKANPYTADNVVENETTLFTDSLASNITYLLAPNDLDGPCYVWGDDSSYYAGFGCEAM